MLEYSSRFTPQVDAPETTTLVFLLPDPPALVEPDKVPPTEPENERKTEPAAAAAPPVQPKPADLPPAVPSTAPTSAPSRSATRPPARPMVAVDAAPSPDEPLRLFAPDGSLSLPDDVVARLDEADGDHRAFDFQLPGLMESGRFMDRQPVLVYEATRFDRYWIPEKDILTSVLEKAVEATTGTVEIPIPGSPGSKLVCTVSILALGGGCGIRDYNDGYVVRLDDPNTLDPEEDAQCRAWWEQIVAAGDQDAWRHTRALYESSCRKPLAKAVSPPG